MYVSFSSTISLYCATYLISLVTVFFINGFHPSNIHPKSAVTTGASGVTLPSNTFSNNFSPFIDPVIVP